MNGTARAFVESIIKCELILRTRYITRYCMIFCTINTRYIYATWWYVYTCYLYTSTWYVLWSFLLTLAGASTYDMYGTINSIHQFYYIIHQVPGTGYTRYELPALYVYMYVCRSRTVTITQLAACSLQSWVSNLLDRTRSLTACRYCSLTLRGGNKKQNTNSSQDSVSHSGTHHCFQLPTLTRAIRVVSKTLINTRYNSNNTITMSMVDWWTLPCYPTYSRRGGCTVTNPIIPSRNPLLAPFSTPLSHTAVHIIPHWLEEIWT